MQWCHGAPGLLPLLLQLHGRLPPGSQAARRLAAAADRAADVIWERGLLTKVTLHQLGATSAALPPSA